MSAVLQDYITRHAARYPDDIAVVHADRRMTYGELDDRSDGLAARLAEVGQPGDRVCLLSSKSPEAIVGIVATLKAHRTYVPIDVTSPAARVEKIVRASAPRWVLSDDAGSSRLRELESHGVVADVAVRRLGVEEPDQPLPRSPVLDGSVTPQTGPDSADPSHQAAYIMFTSGSTGEPKGVVITHENVRRFVEWAVPYFEISRADRHSGHPPLHFDLSVFDLFGTFAAGAELHLIPSELNLVPDKLLEFLRVSAITQWFSVPTALTYLAKHGLMSEPDLPSLKRVLSCGEVLPAGTLNHWMRRVPHARFTNLYGPTETTIASSYFSVPASVEQTGSVPIGTPCDGEQLRILDDHLEPLPPGAVGEICIGGIGVSPGYWQDDERTRTVFVRDPFSSRPGDRLYRTGDLGTVDTDGVFHFVGRCDLQIKSRGYRIELGEIETALGGIAGLVAGAVVGLTTEGFEGMTICCAYSAALGVTTDPTKIRRELSRLLPTYMLPSRWKALPRLPTNGNGKIDRAAIKELFEREHDRSSR